ncbi:DUF3618 domain-containing protein [Actinotalea sp. K2]|uniref:DUF3618 domain-containing protein n=1 Tax=Actinotalea sp. K2 TaxID=2939438 RepID=UPI0020174E75|nr:DUF3618 domain-containing protein [Actinotalea sp. K2]MCL3863122.1 DUF3618 domain-containing protein [Actinotalea sp. K2]
MSTTPAKPATTPQEIEAEIARTRAELQATVDQLSERLDPRVQAEEARDEAKAALGDLRRRVTGDPLLPGEQPATTKGWVVLGAGAAIAALVTAAVVRKL